MHFLAFGLALFLLAYHQVTTWYPLFPWNDVEKYSKKELWTEAGINGFFMALGAVCLLNAPHGFWLQYPLVFYPLLLAGEALSWWIPSIRKRHEQQFKEKFSRTLKFIPETFPWPTPDANHIVLHFMTVITTAVVFFERLCVA